LKRQAAVGSGEKRRLIVVDPGHGGRDSGAVGVSGIHEADVALAIAHRLKRSLERTLDAEVILTRDDDRFVPLQERAAIANALDADLFVSVHANASPSSQAWGIETFYLDAASDAGAARVALRENALSQGEKRDDLLTDLFVTGTNRLSRLLAQQVQGRVIHHVTERFGAEQSHDLGVKTALFAVLVWTRMPSILFESSFLSNPEDEIRLRMPTYQQTLADAMAEGIGLWFEQRGR
jgi:N-acetylmuramoyl-L-alanine amidase